MTHNPQSSQQPGDRPPLTAEQVSALSKQLLEFIQQLPVYMFNTFQTSPLRTAGLVLGAIFGVKLGFAILDALNDIPLVSPTFELVGIGYTAWFTYRYLLFAPNRKELGEQIDTISAKILGKKNN